MSDQRAPEKPTTAAEWRAVLLAQMRRMDCNDGYDDAFHMLTVYETFLVRESRAQAAAEPQDRVRGNLYDAGWSDGETYGRTQAARLDVERLREALARFVTAAEHTHKMGRPTAALDAAMFEARALLGAADAPAEPEK